MADPDSAQSPTAPAPAPPPPPHPSSKENISAVSLRIAELDDSRSVLLTRIKSLKQDLESWRSKLDTQVKIYSNELSDLTKSLNGEVEQLRSEFQDLRTTLQQQQEDVSSSIGKLGLQDVSEDAKGGPEGVAAAEVKQEQTAQEQTSPVKDEN